MDGNEAVGRELDSPADDAIAMGTVTCWGCGEFWQHGHQQQGLVGFSQAALQQLLAQGVKHIACGASHTVAVTESNEIYVWGNGSCGQLGCGNQQSQRAPVTIQLYKAQSRPPNIAGVAAGSRHTFVWLRNGHMFSFGNNFFAQLGYDFHIKNYKENQMSPHLLRHLTYRPVAQVACGEKHSLLLFKDKHIAGLGHNAFGQLGTGNREEAVVPKVLSDMPPIDHIACGANHSMALDESGCVYVWGFGKACGEKHQDLLYPERKRTPHQNVVQLAGGQGHSLALTANGNVYSWGVGKEGQLGHGEKLGFLHQPRRVPFPTLRGKVAAIAAGDSYSAAITGEGALFLWGRNSHVIMEEKAVSFKVYQACRLNSVHSPVKQVACGAWHCAVVHGTPGFQKHNSDSDEDISEDISELETEFQCSLSDMSSVVSEKSSDLDLPQPPLGLQREKTTMTIAEFYAPSPEVPQQNGTLMEDDYPEDRQGLLDSSSMSVKGHQNIQITNLPDQKDTQRQFCISTISDKEEDSWQEQIVGTVSDSESEEEEFRKISSRKNKNDWPVIIYSNRKKTDEYHMTQEPVLKTPNDLISDMSVSSSSSRQDRFVNSSNPVSFKMPVRTKTNLFVNTQKPLLTREKTVLPTKSMDFVPVSKLSTGAFRYGTLDLSKHAVKVKVSPPREKPQSVPVSLRRNQNKFGGTSKSHARDHQTEFEMNSNPGSLKDHNERTLGLPKTVSLFSREASAKPVAGTRNVSIPMKPHFVREKTLGLEVESVRPSTQPLFSSASSWRTDRRAGGDTSQQALHDLLAAKNAPTKSSKSDGSFRRKPTR